MADSSIDRRANSTRRSRGCWPTMPRARSLASRGSPTSIANTGGRSCSIAWRACSTRSVDDGQLDRSERPGIERVGANLHPAAISTEADNHEYEILERLRGVGLRRLGSAAWM